MIKYGYITTETETRIDVGDGYELLPEGERIKEGYDVYSYYNEKWERAYGIVGHIAGEDTRAYPAARRRKQPVPVKDEFLEWLEKKIDRCETKRGLCTESEFAFVHLAFKDVYSHVLSKYKAMLAESEKREKS